VKPAISTAGHTGSSRWPTVPKGSRVGALKVGRQAAPPSARSPTRRPFPTGLPPSSHPGVGPTHHNAAHTADAAELERHPALLWHWMEAYWDHALLEALRELREEDERKGLDYSWCWVGIAIGYRSGNG
jgi:hypothetical protein